MKGEREEERKTGKKKVLVTHHLTAPEHYTRLSRHAVLEFVYFQHFLRFGLLEFDTIILVLSGNDRRANVDLLDSLIFCNRPRKNRDWDCLWKKIIRE